MDASGQGCKRLAQAGCSGYGRRRIERLLGVMRHLSGDAHELIAHYDRHETGGWRGGRRPRVDLRISYSAPYPWPGLDRVGVGDRCSQKTSDRFTLCTAIPPSRHSQQPVFRSGASLLLPLPGGWPRRVCCARSSFRFPSLPGQDIPHRAMQRCRLHCVAHQWMLRAEVTERPDARHRHSRGHHSRRHRF